MEVKVYVTFEVPDHIEWEAARAEILRSLNDAEENLNAIIEDMEWK